MMDAVGTGSLMKIVHILGAEIEPIAHPLLESRKGQMSGVWSGRQSILPTHRVKAPNQFGVGLPSFRCRDLFDTIAVPEPSGAAKCCESTLRRNTGTGQNKQAIAGF